MPHIALPEGLPGITAAFAFYVDGLATWAPHGDDAHDAYDAMGRRMAHEGYVRRDEAAS